VLATGTGKAVIAANLPEALALPGQMIPYWTQFRLIEKKI